MFLWVWRVLLMLSTVHPHPPFPCLSMLGWSGNVYTRSLLLFSGKDSLKSVICSRARLKNEGFLFSVSVAVFSPQHPLQTLPTISLVQSVWVLSVHACSFHSHSSKYLCPLVCCVSCIMCGIGRSCKVDSSWPEKQPHWRVTNNKKTIFSYSTRMRAQLNHVSGLLPILFLHKYLHCLPTSKLTSSVSCDVFSPLQCTDFIPQRLFSLTGIFSQPRGHPDNRSWWGNLVGILSFNVDFIRIPDYTH